jgi:hypothetical protein
MAGFGVPLSSIPNTSWMNVSEPVSSAGGFTGKAVGASSGMFDPLSLTMAGIGAIGNVVGGIFQGNAQRRAAQIQANAANVAALGNLYGQQMAMSQNRLDRGYRSIADLQNIKAATDARADNYRYGMNAHLMKSQSDINQAFVAGGVNMMGNLAGKSMDALNSIIGTNNAMRQADNAFALGRLGARDDFELQKEAGKFKAFFQDPMETAEMGRRSRQDISIALSPEARELRRRERKGRVEEAVAIQRGLMDKMFGNYTPTFYG